VSLKKLNYIIVIPQLKCTPNERPQMCWVILDLVVSPDNLRDIYHHLKSSSI